MKCYVLIFVLFLSGLYTSLAQNIITVNNDENSTADFHDLQEALNSADSGDTIYVQGSITEYGSLVIQKSIVLIGPGRNPDKDLALTANLMDIDLLEGADNTTIDGLIVEVIECIDAVHHLVIKNCNVNRSTSTSRILLSGSDFLLRNNVVRTINGTNSSINVEVNNNVINRRVINFNEQTVVFNNNVFATLYEANPIHTCTWTIFNNNLFWRGVGVSSSIFTPNNFAVLANNVENCDFNNNLTYRYSTNNFDVGGRNTGADNLIDTDPRLVEGGFWELQNGSLGKNAGTDGTDIGIYGGISPYVPEGTADIPQIKTFTIENNIVPPGGTLKIKVTAVGRDH